MPISIAGDSRSLYTQAPAHSTSTGHTRAQLMPSTLALKIVRAAPSTFPVEILRMNSGMLIAVGQCCTHGASTQYRQRFASASACVCVYAGL